MDPHEAQTPQETTLTEKIARINRTISAYRQWNQERLAGQSAARIPPEMTPEQKLGETLVQAENGLKTETAEEFDRALSNIKETPEDDDQAKLIKLHQARTLANWNLPIPYPGTPERTIKILNARPDLLNHPDIHDKYARALLQDQRLLQQTKEMLRNSQGAELPSKPILEIAGRLSEANPVHSFAIFEGFMRGVIAYKDGPKQADPNLIRQTDRKADGYPLDQLTSTLPAEKGSGFLGSGTMRALSERAAVWKKDQFPPRGEATLLGAALAVTLAGSLDTRRNNRNPSIEIGIQDNFVTVVDRLLGDKPLKDTAQDKEDPFQPVSEIVFRADAKLMEKLNARDLKVRDRLRATREADVQQLVKLQKNIAN